VIPPTLLDAAAMDEFVAQMRSPDERRGDLRAQLAAQRLGARRIAELCARRGRDEVIAAMDELVAYSENQQSGSQTPTEEACFTNPNGFDDWFYFYIYRFGASAKPRFDAVITGGYALQFPTAAGSINELAASPNTLAAGAICWQNNALEPFSSRGPTIDNRVKPDIVGQDGVSSATYGQWVDCNGGPNDGLPHGFFGTSAAAPHTAGVAALILGQNPSYTVTQLQSAITGAAQDLGAAGKDNAYGSGKLRVPGIVAPTVSSFAPTAAAVGTTVTIP